MGLFNNLFKKKYDNVINEIAEILIADEKKNTLLKMSPLLKDKAISLNQDGILSFVAAELSFQMETHPLFKTIKLKETYSHIIEKQKKNVSFQLLCKNMSQYYSGDKTLLDLTCVYIWSAWKTEGFIADSPEPAMHYARFKLALRDPILLTTYSMVVSHYRESMSKYFLASMKKLS